MAHAEVVMVRDGREVSLGRIGPARPCDLDLLGALARLQVEARRHGWSISLRHPSGELSDLLVLTGLVDAFPSPPGGHR